MTKVSIVVPVYNEEGNVVELHKEIKDVCEENQYEFEIIFVMMVLLTEQRKSVRLYVR